MCSTLELPSPNKSPDAGQEPGKKGGGFALLPSLYERGTVNLPLTPEEWSRMVEIAPGVMVDQDVLGIVEWIRDYSDSLDVVYLDPNRFDLSPSDPPYKVIETCYDGQTRVVMSCWTLDNRVKERIIAADSQRTDILAALDVNNGAVRKAQEQAFRDSMAEAADMTKHLLLNPKTTYRFRNDDGELLTIEDDKGVVKRAID